MNGMTKPPTQPNSRPLTTISRSAPWPEVERLAVVADDPDAHAPACPSVWPLCSPSRIMKHRRVGQRTRPPASQSREQDRRRSHPAATSSSSPDRPSDDHRRSARTGSPRHDEDQAVDAAPRPTRLPQLASCARRDGGCAGAAGCCQPPGGTGPPYAGAARAAGPGGLRAGRRRGWRAGRGGSAARRGSGARRLGAGGGSAFSGGDHSGAGGLGGAVRRRLGPGRARRRSVVVCRRARSPASPARTAPGLLMPSIGGHPTVRGARLVARARPARRGAGSARARADGGQQRGHGQGDLHAQDALLGPVDVVELEQQRRLVERQAHARAEGHGEPALERLVAGHDRRAAGAERQHDPGHEVVDVAPAHACRLRNGPDRGALAQQRGDRCAR